jgi:glycosyltransferase involved in cell wall biosynthesis
MERASLELIRQAHTEFRFLVVACELAKEARPLVEDWIQVRVPQRPFVVKFLGFALSAGRILTTIESDLVHTIGAIVPNRVDLATVHCCHAAIVASTGSLAPRDAPLMRRVNTGSTRAVTMAAEWWAYRRARLGAIAAVSEGQATQIRNHYPTVPCYITPNGVDAAHFSPDPEIRRALRDALEVTDEVVLVFVGGDWDRKGLAVAIEAVALARRANVKVALWVVGKGDERRFTELAKSYLVEHAVRFWGLQPDTANFYRAADLFLLPSDYESCSLSILEAWASALPAVVSDRCSVEDTRGTRIVRQDAEEVAAVIQELATDEEVRYRVGEQARSRAEQLPWSRSVKQTISLYNSLLDQK